MKAHDDDHMRRCYSRLRQASGVSGRIVVLHLGAERTALAVGEFADAEAVFWLPLGSQVTADEHFKAYPPRPIELENAIAVVEDALMTLRGWHGEGAQLLSSDASLGDFAALAGIAPGAPTRLSVEAVERLFERMASIALGRPMAQDKLPATTSFAATLLILRELMHHQRFAEIVFQPPPAGDE